MEMTHGGYIDDPSVSLDQYTAMKLTGNIKNGRPTFEPADDPADYVIGVLAQKFYGEDADVRDGHALERQMDGTITADDLVSVLSKQNPELTFVLDSASADVVSDDFLMVSGVDAGKMTKWTAGAGNRKIAKVLIGGTKGDNIICEPVDDVSPA